MSQLNTVLNDTASDQIYYDITVSNFQSNEIAPQPFTFTESRTIPFVQCPQDYYLSILRFSIDSGTLPVFIPSIQPGSADPNLTIYSISMSWMDETAFPPRTYNFQKFIEWIPQDISIPVPDAPSRTFNGLQLNDSGYYNCYSYTWLCFVIYTAMQQCMFGLEAAVVAGGVALYPDFSYAPVFNWDTSSNRAVIYADAQVWDLNSAFLNFAPANLYFNAPLFGLFSSFPSRYLGYGQPFGKDFRILVVDVGGTNISPLIPPQAPPQLPATQYFSYLAIACFQETSTTCNITPIQAIVFCTNTLPVEPNQVSTPIVYSNNSTTGFGSNAATANILTDLISDTGLYQPNLVYTPTSSYRLLTMRGNAPLNNIDISVFYRLRNGSLTPFRLQSGGSLSMKLAFLSKRSTRNGVK